MKNFDIKAYMNGCRLTVEVSNDTSHIYQILLNTDTTEVTEVLDGPIRDYDLEEDGIYRVYVIENNNAVLSDGKLKLGSKTYSAEDLVDAIENGIDGLAGSVCESEEIFCICKLKKCLVNLQLKVFQEMLKNCGSLKCKNDSIKSQRDFIFLAVWLMEHLAEANKGEQVRTIYEGIQSCGSICSNLVKSNNCGCNG